MGKDIPGVEKLYLPLVITAIVFSLVNAYFLRDLYRLKKTVCVVDVWKLSQSELLDITKEAAEDKGLDAKARGEKMKGDVDRFIREMSSRFRTEAPKYGCGIVAAKGSILNYDREITEEVYQAYKKAAAKE